MKKRIIALMLCMTTILAFNGCGNAKTRDTEQSTENAKATYNGPSSAKMDIDLEKQVSKLADYKGIDVTISGNYDVTDEDVEKNMLSLLPYYGITGIEIKDRDTVQKGDYVKVDYTGYLDGKAFDGGSATDIMLDVDNNYDVTNQNSYIDGFCDGIVGSKVGSEISTDVTFPDNYNETLGGKKTTFKIKIKGIYEPITLDTLTDDMVADAFSAQNISTKKDLQDYVRKVMEKQTRNAKSQATINEVESYMIENSTVDIPDDYMEARLGEYQAMFERDNLTDTQTMDDYLKKNNTTLDDLKKTWKKSLEKQIKIEFIFGRIADLEDIQVSDDDFKEFVDYLVSSGNSQMTTESEVYDYYGNGSQEEGKKMLRQQYRINKAISYVVEQANVTIEPATESTEN